MMAGGILDRGAFAGRRLAVELQADALPGRAFIDLPQDVARAGEAALLPPPLGDGEQ